MTIRGPQKAILSEDQLPPLTVFDDGGFGYIVRYRIVSEDRNRFSAYSPNFYVRPNYVFERPGGLALDAVGVIRQGPYVNVVWDPIFVKDRVSALEIKAESRYDLYVSWTQEEEERLYLPAERFDGNIQGFIVPSSYTLSNGTTVDSEPTHLSVEIYVRSTNRSRGNSELLVYKIEDVNIEPPLPDPAT